MKQSIRLGKSNERSGTYFGQPIGTVYETTEMLGLTWLTGGTSETTAPYHVFR
jgi:hypothetical protein